MRKIARLQVIASDGFARSHEEIAVQACEAGATWIQLRVKGREFGAWCELASKVRAICARHKATFIVNDSVDVALAVGADGVHLGKNDGDPIEARLRLGPEAIIGGTANSVLDVEGLVNAGVDYIGLGPLRFTSTKSNLSTVLGIEGVGKIVAAQLMSPCPPIIVIGGVLASDVSQLLSVGAHGVAVGRAIAEAHDSVYSAGEFLAQLRQFDQFTLDGGAYAVQNWR